MILNSKKYKISVFIILVFLFFFFYYLGKNSCDSEKLENTLYNKNNVENNGIKDDNDKNKIEIPELNNYMDVKEFLSFDEKIVPVDLSSNPRAMEFRGILRDASERASREGSNFAGHYSIAEFGCGTACQNFAMIDNINGQVYFPEIGASLGYEYKIMSRLLVVNSPWAIYEYCGDGCDKIEWLYSRYYEWNEEKKEFDFITAFKPNIELNGYLIDVEDSNKSKLLEKLEIPPQFSDLCGFLSDDCEGFAFVDGKLPDELKNKDNPTISLDINKTVIGKFNINNQDINILVVPYNWVWASGGWGMYVVKNVENNLEVVARIGLEKKPPENLAVKDNKIYYNNMFCSFENNKINKDYLKCEVKN